MKKLIFAALAIAALSCNKNSDTPHKEIIPPTLLGVDVSSQMVDTILRPKFTFNLNVPDTGSVKSLIVFQIGKFPFNISGQLTGLSSGKVVFIDMTQKYPPTSPIKYTSVFALADGTAILNDSFDLK